MSSRNHRPSQIRQRSPKRQPKPYLATTMSPLSLHLTSTHANLSTITTTTEAIPCCYHHIPSHPDCRQSNKNHDNNGSYTLLPPSHSISPRPSSINLSTTMRRTDKATSCYHYPSHQFTTSLTTTISPQPWPSHRALRVGATLAPGRTPLCD